MKKLFELSCLIYLIGFLLTFSLAPYKLNLAPLTYSDWFMVNIWFPALQAVIWPLIWWVKIGEIPL